MLVIDIITSTFRNACTLWTLETLRLRTHVRINGEKRLLTSIMSVRLSTVNQRECYWMDLLEI